MRSLIGIIILFPVVVLAQGQPGTPPNMSQKDIEQMQRNMQQMDMGKMQEAMACMKNIDQSALQRLDQEGRKMKAEVAALCRSGKRDQAMATAMEYGKEMMKKPEIKKMRECGKMMAGMMPQLPFENIEEKQKDGHLCDEF